jgi:dihydroorotate dehydrogenase (NAD+) catalytic subunit
MTDGTRAAAPGVTRSLAADLDGFVLPTPVVVASGCAGTGDELRGLVDLRRVGAVVSRTVTVMPRRGSGTPRVSESPSGIVWDTGLQNPGMESFVQQELPRLARGALAIVSIGGGTLEDFVRLTSALQGRPEVAAIEVHLSGPDEELRRAVLGAHADRVGEIVGAVSRMSLVPVFAKLPAAAHDVAELAHAAVRAGAHGLTIGGSPPALAVDGERLRPELGGVTGWLSGPAVRPLTLRSVFEVARALPEVPILAVGGVRTGGDAIQMLLAGAWAVQVGTAVLVDPSAPVAIAQDIARHLADQGLASPADLRARLRVPASFDAPVGETP